MENFINTLVPIAKYIALIFWILAFLNACIYKKTASPKIKVLLILLICVAIVSLVIMTFWILKR